MKFQPQVELPRLPEPASECDVLREQIDYLIQHTQEHGTLDCPECRRYLKVRSALLESSHTVLYDGIAIGARPRKAA